MLATDGDEFPLMDVRTIHFGAATSEHAKPGTNG
jgi:hypothetical protein